MTKNFWHKLDNAIIILFHLSNNLYMHRIDTNLSYVYAVWRPFCFASMAMGGSRHLN